MSSTENEYYGNCNVSYSEMNENDQTFAIELATNALKLQDKGEQTVYHKDIAQHVKQELDKSKGYKYIYIYIYIHIYDMIFNFYENIKVDLGMLSWESLLAHL